MAAAKSAVSQKLREPFPTEKVYRREGPGKKCLDYVAGETVIERLLEAAPDFEWSGSIHSIEDGRAVVEGTLTIPGAGSGYGVGSAKMGGDLDSSLKAANTEAIKNAAKNGFGVGLELWDADYRAKLASARSLSTLAAKKKRVFQIAEERLGKKPKTAGEVAEVFGKTVQAVTEEEGLVEILTAEGLL